MMTAKNSPLGFLRKVGFAEGLSWLLLLGVAMPLKYIAKEPMPVKIVGWIHGLLFISYVLLLIRVQFAYRWPLKYTIFGFVAAFLPFGTWFYDARLKKQEKAIA